MSQEDMRMGGETIRWEQREEPFQCFKVRVKNTDTIDKRHGVIGFADYEMDVYSEKDIYVIKETYGRACYYAQISCPTHRISLWNWDVTWLEMDTMEPVTIMRIVDVPIKIEPEDDF
jgi:hypothetical protein